jgi:hypothetical protein
MTPGIDDDFPGEDLPSTPMPANPYKKRNNADTLNTLNTQVTPNEAEQSSRKRFKASSCTDQSTGKYDYVRNRQRKNG